MPILSCEPDINPPDLLSRPEIESEKMWWAMYTRSNREKELMRRLLAMEVGFYGPTVEQKHRSGGGRIRKAFLPLFRNYVFVWGDPDDRYRALTTNCISRDVPVHDVGDLVHDLRQIRRLITAGKPVTIESRIAPGTKVRIRNGALAGYEGLVVKRQGQARLVIVVDFLQQGASVEIGDFEVEAI